MKKKAAAIGTFDGVHRGHQTVLDHLKSIAVKRNLDAMAITFSSHPLSVINPKKCPEYINSLEEKTLLLENSGVSTLVLEFNTQLQNTTAREWLKRLNDEFNVEVLLIGYDTSFGSDCKSLTLDDYIQLGKDTGVEIMLAPYLPDTSSSAIRQAIRSGEIENANRMLGRPYSIEGTVVEGNRLGRTIGFPTANLLPAHNRLLPKDGVYEGEVTLPDGNTLPSMINIGKRPTVNNGTDRLIEIHILGWKGDLYHKKLTVKFFHRLRDEKKFESLQDLKIQIQRDKESITRLQPVETIHPGK